MGSSALYPPVVDYDRASRALRVDTCFLLEPHLCLEHDGGDSSGPTGMGPPVTSCLGPMSQMSGAQGTPLSQLSGN